MSRAATAADSALAAWLDRWSVGVACRPDVIAVRGGAEVGEMLSRRYPGAQLLSLESRASIPEWRAALRRALALRLEVFRCATPEPLAHAEPSEAEFNELVDQVRRNAEIETGTQQRLAPIWHRNLAEFVRSPSQPPSISVLGAPFANAPVLVLGAGPSLEESMPLIRAQRHKLVLLAATSALRPLWQHGIVPDAAALIEPRDCRGHLAGIPDQTLEQIVLLHASHADRATQAASWRARVVFHGACGAWLANWSGPDSVVPTAGNVGTAMIYLAWRLGSTLIFTSGVDFALAHGRYYAANAGVREAEHDPSLARPVPSWNSEPRMATPELIAFREGTELILGEILRVDPRSQFVALSERSARVVGMKCAPLARLLAVLETAPRGALLEACRTAPRKPLERTRLARDWDDSEAQLRQWCASPEGLAMALVRSRRPTLLSEQLAVQSWLAVSGSTRSSVQERSQAALQHALEQLRSFRGD